MLCKCGHDVGSNLEHYFAVHNGHVAFCEDCCPNEFDGTTCDDEHSDINPNKLPNLLDKCLQGIIYEENIKIRNRRRKNFIIRTKESATCYEAIIVDEPWIYPNYVNIDTENNFFLKLLSVIGNEGPNIKHQCNSLNNLQDTLITMASSLKEKQYLVSTILYRKNLEASIDKEYLRIHICKAVKYPNVFINYVPFLQEINVDFDFALLPAPQSTGILIRKSSEIALVLFGHSIIVGTLTTKR